MQDLPPWVKEFNDKKIAEIYMSQSWNPKFPFSDYFQRCLPDDNKYETGIQGRKTFPYNLAEMGGVVKGKKKYGLLKTTPFGNTFTKDFAISEIIKDSLGRDNYTDLLMISWTQNLVNKTYWFSLLRIMVSRRTQNILPTKVFRLAILVKTVLLAY